MYHVDLVPALLIYQARIFQYAEHHDFNSVVYYDAAIRTRMANNPVMHWDDQFPDKFNSFLGREGGRRKYGTAAAALYFIRNQPGHFALSCSLRGPYPNRFYPFPPTPNLPRRYWGASELHAVQLPSGLTANFRPQKQRIQFCGQYNKYGRCSAGCHPATPKCNRPDCERSHPGRTCSSFTQLNF